MKVVRSSQWRVSLLDVEPAQFALLVDAVAELNRGDSPMRPFSGDFQRLVDRLTLELSAGRGLFDCQYRGEAVSPVFRVVPSEPDPPSC